MIPLTRLSGETVWVSAGQIETVEASPDTVLTLVSGRKLVVRETPEEVRALVVAFQRQVLAGAFGQGEGPQP